MSLWTAPLEIDPAALAFTTGSDREYDRRLLPYDCTASIAHAEGLAEIGLLTEEELSAIRATLERVRSEILAGLVIIPREMEDGHEYLESRLVAALGETGRKIHAYRSRNDQIWTAQLLFCHDHIGRVSAAATELAAVVGELSRRYGHIPLPGFTHTRKAMPTTIAAWCGLYRSSLCDSGQLLSWIGEQIHRSPLGSGVGYGFDEGPDRRKISERLGFTKVMEEPMYAQASRSKYSAWVVFACATLMQDLNRLASDLILFSLAEFGFFKLPDNMLLGSSAMPHKRNPDVLEVIRGNYSVVLAHQQQIMTLAANLIYGYHRDLQLTKGPLIESLDLTRSSLEMAARFLIAVEIDEDACSRAMAEELYSVKKALDLTRQGQSFRNAHGIVAKKGWEEPQLKDSD